MPTRFSLFAVLLTLPFLLRCGSVRADESWSTDLDLSASSEYLFRGFRISRGTVFQPSISTSSPPESEVHFSAGLWMSTPLDDEDPANEVTEFDPTVAVDYTVSRATVTLGGIGYLYSDAPANYPGTGEIFGALSLETALDPVFTAYRDLGYFDSTTYELSFSHRFDASESVGEEFNLTPFVSFGFSSHGKRKDDPDGSDYVSFGFSTDLFWGPYPVTPLVTMMKGFDPGTTDQIALTLSIRFAL